MIWFAIYLTGLLIALIWGGYENENEGDIFLFSFFWPFFLVGMCLILIAAKFVDFGHHLRRKFK